MRCRFCNAPATLTASACRVCGARLTPTAPDFSTAPRPKLQPLAPVPIGVEAERAPELLARISRAPDAPRIVASGFVGDESGATTPILVLENGEMQLWDIEGGLFPIRAPRRFAAKRTAIPATCAAFSSSVTIVASGHESGNVLLHQLEPFAPRDNVPSSKTTSFAAHRGRVLSLGFAESHLWSAGIDGAVLSLVLNQKGALGREQIVMDGVAWLRCLAVSTDGARLALGGENGELQIWGVAPEGTLEGREWAMGRGDSALKWLEFSANGQMLLGTDTTGTTRLWAAQTGHELQQFSAQTTDSAALAPVLAPDNRLLAVPGLAQVQLLDSWTGTAHTTIPLPFERVQALAFAPTREDGGRHTCLLIAGAGEIALWKVGL